MGVDGYRLAVEGLLLVRRKHIIRVNRLFSTLGTVVIIMSELAIFQEALPPTNTTTNNGIFPFKFFQVQ